MNTIIQNLRTLNHFDAQGNFFSKQNISIRIDSAGIIQEIKKGTIAKKGKANVIDGKSLLGLPSFVDCHSHCLFAGNRSHEFQMKCEGKTYLDIAAEGGGILYTQKSTEAASNEELQDKLSERIQKFMAQGIHGLEIKTGYGLKHDEEIRHLRIIQKMKKKFRNKIKIWVTYLGPHAVLKRVDRQFYLDEICNKTLPLIASEKLADFVDIFVDEGFFSTHDMDRYCETANHLGLLLKAHIDEIKNLEASEIAAKHGLISVDHCRHTTLNELELLKKHDVQVVFLPVTSFYIDEGFINMNVIRNIGMKPAISLDYNPGSQPALWWPFLLYIAMKKMKMTEAEVLHATTLAPLSAVNEKTEDWSFTKGKKCKLNLFRAESVSELAYRYGENLLEKGIFRT